MSPTFSTGAEIRFATRQDIEPIARLLTELFRGSVAFWRSIMNYPWLPDDEKPHFGAVLMVNGKPCGFNGVIFADRKVDGRVERFASGFGWCVRPEYRRFSLGLLMQLRNPDLTWTNLSSRDELIPLFLRMGYAFADTRQAVCYPRAHMLLPRGGDRLRIIEDDMVSEETLGADTFQVYGDHFMSTVQRTVFEASGRTCLVVTRRRYVPGRFRGFPASELYYSSDREFFARHFDQILLRLLRRDKCVALLAEERLLNFRPKNADSIPAKPLFRSPRVPAEKIDNLYSEKVLLLA